MGLQLLIVLPIFKTFYYCAFGTYIEAMVVYGHLIKFTVLSVFFSFRAERSNLRVNFEDKILLIARWRTAKSAANDIGGTTAA